MICPTCGLPVKVIGGDEGTNHYEPVCEWDIEFIECHTCGRKGPLKIKEKK